MTDGTGAAVIHRTAEVFGIQREVPANYVTRPSVDDVFIDSLTRDKHIVVYGSSKQGKTSLRKFHLRTDEYIVVTCWYQETLGQLMAAILKEAGYVIEQSTSRTVRGEAKINARFGFKALGVGGEAATSEESERITAPLELDPSDVNDILRALNEVGFSKFIVLEDFHYLPTETQEAFSVALKAFHESSSITFVIVGVWLDENRLVQYNGDLTGRVLAIDADAWSPSELAQVITAGEQLLNISIDAAAREQIVSSCFESVYIVQEACFRVCMTAGVAETQQTYREIGSGTDVNALVRDIVGEQSARYQAFLDNFAGGFQETQLEMYRWVLLPILMASDNIRETGVKWGTIRRVLDANHPQAPLNPGNLTQALGSVASLQVKAKITPIILDYDQTRKRLNVVDRGFLVWLGYQDLAELRSELGLPASPTVPEGAELQ